MDPFFSFTTTTTTTTTTTRSTTTTVQGSDSSRSSLASSHGPGPSITSITSPTVRISSQRRRTPTTRIPSQSAIPSQSITRVPGICVSLTPTSPIRISIIPNQTLTTSPTQTRTIPTVSRIPAPTGTEAHNNNKTTRRRSVRVTVTRNPPQLGHCYQRTASAAQMNPSIECILLFLVLSVLLLCVLGFTARYFNTLNYERRWYHRRGGW